MVDLLSKQLADEDFHLQADDACEFERKLFASPPKTDLEEMRQVLEAAAKGEITPPPSLNQLAIQLKCNQTTLQRRFPELAEKIKAFHRQYGEIRIEVRGKLSQSIVNSAAMSIYNVGLYPSQARVRDSLPSWLDIRGPVVYQQWKKTLAELKNSVD